MPDQSSAAPLGQPVPDLATTPSGVPATPDPAEAQAMIDVLASVGVEEIDLTILDHHGSATRYERFRSGVLRRSISGALAWAASRQRSVIVRPVAGPGAALIQLDDLSADTVDRLRPVAFLGVETSPGNFQAWIALPAAESDAEFRRRLCRGTGADLGASGAVRIAGSTNFKPEHGPAFPRVRLVHTAPGRITTGAALESLGVVAVPEAATAQSAASAELDSMITFDLRRWKRKPRRWPDYQRCLDGAPPNGDGTGPDRSKADFTWCMIGIDWGWTVEQTAARLMGLSDKAHEHGEDYALRTARNAAEAVRVNRQRPI